MLVVLLLLAVVANAQESPVLEERACSSYAACDHLKSTWCCPALSIYNDTHLRNKQLGCCEGDLPMERACVQNPTCARQMAFDDVTAMCCPDNAGLFHACCPGTWVGEPFLVNKPSALAKSLSTDITIADDASSGRRAQTPHEWVWWAVTSLALSSLAVACAILSLVLSVRAWKNARDAALPTTTEPPPLVESNAVKFAECEQWISRATAVALSSQSARSEGL
ncbi:EF-hand domain-containing protein [Pycnococcus provasolii]